MTRVRATPIGGDNSGIAVASQICARSISSPSHTAVCSSSAWLLAPKKRGCAGDAAKSGSAAKRVSVPNSLSNFPNSLA